MHTWYYTKQGPWAIIDKGKTSSSHPAGYHKLQPPQKKAGQKGVATIMEPIEDPKENIQEEVTAVTYFQQGTTTTLNNSIKKQGSTGSQGHRSIFKWPGKKRQQEDEKKIAPMSVPSKQGSNNEKDSRHDKLKRSGSRDSVWTNASKGSIKSSHSSRDAPKKRSNDNDKDSRDDQLKRSGSRDSVWTNASKSSNKSTRSKGSTTSSIWTDRSRDALKMSVVRSSRSRDAIKRSRSKDSIKKSRSKDNKLTRNASEDSIKKSCSKDNKLKKNASEDSVEQWKMNLCDNDLIMVQKRKSAWIKNMKKLQAQTNKQNNDDNCNAECRNQAHEERDLIEEREEQQPSADELGIFALKNIKVPSPSSLAFINPGHDNNNQFSTLTNDEGGNRDDNNLGGGPAGMDFAMVAAMDGIQKSSHCLDSTMVHHLHAMDVTKEHMTRLYYKVAATVSPDDDDEADDVAAAAQCFTIPLLADLKAHVGTFQWTDCVSFQDEAKKKSSNGHSTTATRTTLMPTCTTDPNQSALGTITTTPATGIIHKQAPCKNHNSNRGEASMVECNSEYNSEYGMATMIGADGSLYQVQVLRKLPAQEEEQRNEESNSNIPLLSQAQLLPTTFSVVQSSPPGAPMREQPEMEEMTAINNKHVNNNDVGIAAEQDMSQEQFKRELEKAATRRIKSRNKATMETSSNNKHGNDNNDDGVGILAGRDLLSLDQGKQYEI